MEKRKLNLMPLGGDEECFLEIELYASVLAVRAHKLVKKWGIINIYGVPRGGLILAVKLSYFYNIPMIFDKEKITDKTMIVDDIADTGKTLKPFDTKFIVTLYYKKGSMVAPDVWVREKTDKWIDFPWEAK